MKQKNSIDWTISLKGMAMGLAEIIPGVSGGTIAFVTGIYERLILAIKSFDFSLLKDFKEGGVKKVWEKVDGNFLLLLFIGMFGGLVVGAFFITWLIEHYPLQLWGFFFGLIFASFIYIVFDISSLDWKAFLLLTVGAIIAYIITTLSPAEGNTSYWFIALSGAIAISALMLPGISGSFILLLLGMYTFIMPTFKRLLSSFEFESFLIIAVFAIGCIIGMVVFSRVISWTFNRFRNQTLALLSGFILGSLNKIWPWRLPVLWMDSAGNLLEDREDLISQEKLKVMKEQNFWPTNFPEEPHIWGALLSMLLGASIVFLLSRLEKRKAQNNNPEPVSK